MAYENTTDITYVNTGSQPNDGTGDPIRTSFFKTNSSFKNIDERLTSGNLGPIYSRTFITANANLYVGTTSVFNGNATFNNDFTVLGVHRGQLTVTGNLVVNGTQTILNTVNSVINDSIINLHSPNDNSPLIADDGKDIGIKLHYFKGVDNHAFVGWANDTGYLEYYAAGTEVGNVFSGTAYGTIKSGEYFSSNATNSSSTATGAIRTNGGLGVALRATLGSLVVDGATTLTGTVTISGSTSVPTLVATNFSTGNAQITGGSVTGLAQLRGTTVYAENFSSANVLITGGSINNTPIGASTATTGRFTDVTVTNNITVNGWAMVNSDITGVGTIHISDPGTNEGIIWDNGNGWAIFEAPNAYANTSGNLQFDHSGTRVLTLNTDNQVDIPGTTDASSSTTGILKVAGGVGIAKKLYVGTAIVPSVGSGVNGIVFPADPGGGSGDGASIQYYITSGEATVLELKITNDADDYISLNAPGYVKVEATTAASSTTSGALRVGGGLGVAGNAYASNFYGDFFYANGSSVSSVISGAVIGGLATSISLAGTSGTGSVTIGNTLTFAGNYGVTATASGATITIGTPQDLQTTASPQFAGMTMSGAIVPTGNVAVDLGAVNHWWNNVYGNAIRAVYADLAENYVADKEYEPGTVLIFGGDEEVTECTKYTDPRVAGVVSTNPAYLMNGALENGTPIALRGRVPVKVIGLVSKGDFLVTSEVAGHAVAVSPDVNYGHAVFAKSIQNKTDSAPGVIEAVII
jgi:hypothetical protein